MSDYAQAMYESQFVYTPKGRKLSLTETPEDRPSDAPSADEVRAEGGRR